MISDKELSCILASVQDVGVQQTVNIICPCCTSDWEEAGRPTFWRPNRSMSVTKERFNVKWNCFRATCPRGRGVKVQVSTTEGAPKSFTPSRYTDDLHCLSEQEKQFLKDRFYFTDEQIQQAGIRFNANRATYVFSVHSINNEVVGVVDRDFFSKRSLKAITYWFKDVPKLHFVGNGSNLGGTCLVVEDIPSAIRAGKYVTTAALLGSHLTIAQAKHLGEHFSTVVIALDDDAFLKSFKIRKMLGFYFKECKIIRLRKDIKNMRDKEVKKLLENGLGITN